MAEYIKRDVYLEKLIDSRMNTFVYQPQVDAFRLNINGGMLGLPSGFCYAVPAPVRCRKEVLV